MDPSSLTSVTYSTIVRTRVHALVRAMLDAPVIRYPHGAANVRLF